MPGGVGGSATVAFLFVDLVGSTELLHRLGDDANDELSRRYQRTLRECVDRHGGRLMRSTGDGLAAVFEHSVAAAVSTAVDLQRSVDRLARAEPLVALEVRVGLSAGEATVLDGEWSGTPIVEAARLEAAARPGTILATDVVRLLLGRRGGFEFSPVDPVALKGFPEPIAACEVRWEREPGLAALALPPTLTAALGWPLTGRDAELSTLLDAWRRVVATGRGAVVRIGGEPGIGKTRLVAEVAVRVQAGSAVPAGAVLYGVAAADGDGAVPLGPLVDALRWWVAAAPSEVLRRAVDDRAEVLASLVPSLSARLPELVSGDRAVDLDAVTAAVVGTLAAAAVDGPHLVVVDADNGLDPACSAALDALGRSDRPVLVVVCASQGDPDVRLAGVTESAAAQLLDLVVGGAGLALPEGDLVSRAVAETGGNPGRLLEAVQRLVASGALAGGDVRVREVAVRRALTGASPYLGLLTFQADDADDFFGRGDEVAALLTRVANSRLVAVVGSSGTGKSSLVRAGLVPALRRGALPGSAAWPVAVFTPGRRPLLELAAAVAQAVGRPAVDVLAALEQDPSGLDGVLRDALADPVSRRLLLIVDQFEEVFTACRDTTERERFAAALVHAAGAPGSRAVVVPVVRADFYGRCAELPGLGAIIDSATLLLGPMSERSMREAIEGPATRAHARLEPGLVDALVADVAGEPGGLPLLSHALFETWERRDGRTLTMAGYRDAGGARGAIARTAEQLYTDRLGPAQQRMARSLFLALTELGEGSEDTRRRVARHELAERFGDAETLDGVVEALVAARLLTVGDDIVEVAHEAVIREWPRLRSWLEDDRDALRALRNLGHAAAEWEAGGFVPDDLYRGPRLASATEAAEGAALTEVEHRFLVASSEAEERRARARARQNRRLRRALATVGLLLVVSVVAGLVAVEQRSRANERTADADFARLTSQALDLATTDADLAVLLALEANRLRDDPTSRSALFSTLQRNRGFEGFTPTHGVPTDSALTDERVIAYGTRDATLGFADLETGAATHPSIDLGPAPREPVTVLVADDPTHTVTDPVVAARADTGQVFLVDPVTGTLVGSPIETGQAVFALAASSRLGLLAVGGEDSSVALYDLDTRERVVELPPPSDPTEVEVPAGPDQAVAAYGAGGAVIDDGDAVALDFSPTRPELAVARPDSSIERWPVPGGGSPRAVSPGQPVPRQPGFGTLLHRPDGGLVFLANPAVEGSYLAVDLDSVEVRWSLAAVDVSPTAGFDDGGERLVVADPSGAVTAYDPETGEVLESVVETGLRGAVSLDLAGERLVLAGGTAPVVGAWSLDGSGPLVGVFGPGRSYPQDISSDSDSILVGTKLAPSGTRWSVWDPRGRRLLVDDIPILLGGYAGDRLLVGYFEDGTAGGFDVDRGRRVPPEVELSLDESTGAITIPEIGLIALGHEDGVVDFFDRDGGRPYPAFDAGGWARVRAVSDDGSMVVVTSETDAATVYATADGSVVAGPVEGFQMGEFTADDKGLYLATEADGLREVSLPNLEPVADPFPPLPASINNLTLSNDGRLLSASDISGRLRIHDVATRIQLGDDILLGPQDGDPTITGIGDMAADGTYAVIEGADGIEAWDLEPDLWREVACRVAGRNLTRQEWETYLPNAGDYRPTCPQWPGG